MDIFDIKANSNGEALIFCDLKVVCAGTPHAADPSSQGIQIPLYHSLHSLLLIALCISYVNIRNMEEYRCIVYSCYMLLCTSKTSILCYIYTIALLHFILSLYAMYYVLYMHHTRCCISIALFTMPVVVHTDAVC